MTRRPARLLVLTACVLLASAAAARAQSLSDRGKRKLPKLFTQAVAAASQSTVRVECAGEEKHAALGTVVSADGYILSKGTELLDKQWKNFREPISCRLADGTVYDAQVVGYHKQTDLALLKIDADGLKPVTFADVKPSEVGDWVAAVGPGPEPLAVGMLSAPTRKLSTSLGSEESRTDNLNKGYLGILLEDPADGEGVVVLRVTNDSAAARAGLKAKDLICEVSGKVVKSRDALMDLLNGFRPDDTVTLRVKRGDEELTLKVRLGRLGDIDRGAFQNTMGSSLSGRRTGFPAVLQHDTVVRPSDCGGPLVDLDGRVLGINIARAGRVETWALPGEVIKPVLKELKEGKYSSPVKK